MQVNPQNNRISFKSVIPVKVIANGIEATDEETIRKGCNAVIREISGPIWKSTNPAIRPAAATLSTMDPHYNYFLAYTRGYKNIHDNAINSDYFKTIMGSKSGYILTGPKVQELSEIGVEIGRARKECRQMGINDSIRLRDAYSRYHDTLNKIGTDNNERICEIFDRKTGKKLGKQQQMEVHITTKTVKRDGKPTVVVKSIDQIDFKNK